MYEIWADDLLIHSDVTPLETVKAINPVLTLEDSAAGSLEFSLPPINKGYSDTKIKRMVTDITVKENGEWLWSGRVLRDSFDFWNNRKIVCEGELAFLNDSIQPPHKYDVENDHTTITTFFTALINNHNSQVAANRQFQIGMILVNDGDVTDNSDSIYRFTNYETTLACINDKLVERLKGHIRIRHQDGLRYIDYIRDQDLTANSQIVRFGVNLLDFSKNIDMSELSTAIVPRGARLEIDESDSRYIEGLEPYLTIEEVDTDIDQTDSSKIWHTKGEMFIKNPDAFNNFGWVCTVVDWDSVTDKDTLYSKAKKYLQDEQYEKMTLEIQALDLKYLSNSNDPIRFQSKLRCISQPHGMDHTFIVSKMQVDLTNPGNSIYTLGTDVKLSLTQTASRVNSEVQEKIDKIPSKHEILRAAQNNAYQMIMGTDNSYIHTIPSKDANGKNNGIKRIEVTDGPTYNAEADNDDDPTTDPFPDSLNRWIWTVGGLGHIGRETYQQRWDGFDSNTGTFPGTPENPLLNVAMTYDGSIVADRITAGKLRVYDQNNPNKTLYILDTDSGYVQMEYAKLGPWYLNVDGRGLTDRTSAWIAPNDISCGNYGSLLIGMRCDGRRYDEENRGYLEVSINNYQRYGDDCDGILVHWNMITRHLGDEEYAKFENGSDERIKEDIQELSLEEALKIINGTELLTFRYKKGDHIKHYGVTAQRMEKECEELGIENPFVKALNEELKTVDYDQFIAPIMRVLQEQQKQIEELQNKK